VTFWTFDTLKQASGGSWLSRGKDPEATASMTVDGLSTDSRTLKGRRAFLALRGDRFDGHAFLADAVKAGSPLLIVDEAGASAAVTVAADFPDHDVAILRVSDTGKALLRLATAYRRTLERTKVIAVVGSNGKTTTTRLIAAALSASLRGTASAKSFNNAIGVPLTILAASASDQYLLCEVGTNAPGEIAQLGAVVQPDIVVVTSIGREHLEGFGSIEGVAREEAAIFSFLAQGGLSVVPAELPSGCKPLTDLLKTLPNVVRFGVSDAADLRASNIRHVHGRLHFSINNRLDVALNLVGEHNALNALAAVAIGRRFGIEEGKIAQSLSAAKGPEMRLERVEVAVGRDNRGNVSSTQPGVVTFLNDAYNANPDSMLASLATFEQLLLDWPCAGRRVAILGDMLELGEASESLHREIGVRLSTFQLLDRIVLVGPRSVATADALTSAGWPLSKILYVPVAGDAEMHSIADLLGADDVVLLKGSRGMKLERVIESLQRRQSSPPPRSTTPLASASVTLNARPPQRTPGSPLK